MRCAIVCRNIACAAMLLAGVMNASEVSGQAPLIPEGARVRVKLNWGDHE